MFQRLLFLAALALTGVTIHAGYVEAGLWDRVRERFSPPPIPRTPDDVKKQIEDEIKRLEDTRQRIEAILNPDTVSEALWGEAGRVAYPDAAAAMAVKYPKGDALTGKLKRQLRRHFGRLVDKVTIHWGAELPDQWAAGRFNVKLSKVESEAQTYGYDIYVKHDRDAQPAEYYFLLIGHELVHVQQFEDLDRSYSKFGYEYFREYKKANLEYKKNKMEREAYEREAALEGQWDAPLLKVIGPDLDGPEKTGEPSEVAIAVDGDVIYWVDSKHRFRMGHVNDDGKLYAIRNIDGPEKTGEPSQVVIAVDGGVIYWVDSKHRFRMGHVNDDGKLYADQTIDGPEETGEPSQVAIAVDGEWIYWVDSKHRFRRGKVVDGKLKAIGPDIDVAEKDGRPSQLTIAVEGEWIYWVDSDARLRRGKLNDEGKIKYYPPDIDGPEDDGSPSQVIIAVNDNVIYWVDSKARFRRGKIE